MITTAQNNNDCKPPSFGQSYYCIHFILTVCYKLKVKEVFCCQECVCWSCNRAVFSQDNLCLITSIKSFEVRLVHIKLLLCISCLLANTRLKSSSGPLWTFSFSRKACGLIHNIDKAGLFNYFMVHYGTLSKINLWYIHNYIHIYIFIFIIYEFPHQQDRERLTTLLFIAKLKTFDKRGATSVFPLFLRSTKAMSLSLRRTRRWSPSSSNTFTTTGRVTACLSPPWWRESFSSWWGTHTQWHGASLQTMTATVPEKHANPVYSQEECATYLSLLLESMTSFLTFSVTQFLSLPRFFIS